MFIVTIQTCNIHNIILIMIIEIMDELIDFYDETY